MNPEELARRFAHHNPSDHDVAAAHEQARYVFAGVAEWINVLLPDSIEKTRTIDAVDDACKHMNAAIARGQVVDRGVLHMLPSLPSKNSYASAHEAYGR